MGATLDYLSAMFGSGHKTKRRKHLNTVELKVRMDCEGCELKIKKLLSSMKGVESVEVIRKQQKVTVIGFVEPNKVLKKVVSTGKKAEMWPYVPYNLVAHPYAVQSYDKKAPPGFVRNAEVVTKQEDQFTNLFSDDNPNACSVIIAFIVAVFEQDTEEAQFSGNANSNLEELHQEIGRFQRQLQIYEERLRYFEPDPMSATSMAELESCEKFLMEALTRVTERKKYLLGDHHLSSYDASNPGMQMFLQPHQEDMQGTFGNEMVHWVPESAPNPSQHIFVGSESFIPSLRDHGMYDHQISQGTGLQMDPQMGGCHISGQGDSNLPAWHQAYTSTELLSNLIAANNHFPLLQQHMAAPDLPEMVPHEQVEGATSCSHVQGETDGTCTTTYEGNSGSQVNGG
ncbi:hypothetical protein J5N97_006735 [Dioscorea zingiberensis]|uniref:HMA domain-containing protein n=1 Tax=Dioscorea zingiberensis TaxID=325984 RepID=A0A9D5DBA3_9LILI|nr:hypothetical protein J5N97_006735 [Dioscorea zingiberensis]